MDNLEKLSKLLPKIDAAMYNTDIVYARQLIANFVRDNKDGDVLEDFAFVLFIKKSLKCGWTVQVPYDCQIALPCDITLIEFVKDVFFLKDTTFATTSKWEREHRCEFNGLIENVMNRTFNYGISFEKYKEMLGIERYPWEDWAMTKFTSDLNERPLPCPIKPMLAKKLEDTQINEGTAFTITEKLDGNRALLYYCIKTKKWWLQSRSGKIIEGMEHITDFAQDEYKELAFSIQLVYDGELMDMSSRDSANFQNSCGVVNSKKKDKKHITFVIFDIANIPLVYEDRRLFLKKLNQTLEMYSIHSQENNPIEVLPVLYSGYDQTEILKHCDEITSQGGEGVMVNLNKSYYEEKRCNALLKVKKTKTMDMRVIGWDYGNGKYEGDIGALICTAFDTENHREINCRVGSGLSEKDRGYFRQTGMAVHQFYVKNWQDKIVEVAYFDISKSQGKFSLRFPRLKGVRDDKTETSVY